MRKEIAKRLNYIDQRLLFISHGGRCALYPSKKLIKYILLFNLNYVQAVLQLSTYYSPDTLLKCVFAMNRKDFIDAIFLPLPGELRIQRKRKPYNIVIDRRKWSRLAAEFNALWFFEFYYRNVPPQDIAYLLKIGHRNTNIVKWLLGYDHSLGNDPNSCIKNPSLFYRMQAKVITRAKRNGNTELLDWMAIYSCRGMTSCGFLALTRPSEDFCHIHQRIHHAQINTIWITNRSYLT